MRLAGLTWTKSPPWIIKSLITLKGCIWLRIARGTGGRACEMLSSCSRLGLRSFWTHPYRAVCKDRGVNISNTLSMRWRNHRKFSAVFGTTSANSSILILPSSVPPIGISFCLECCKWRTCRLQTSSEVEKNDWIIGMSTLIFQFLKCWHSSCCCPAARKNEYDSWFVNGAEGKMVW